MIALETWFRQSLIIRFIMAFINILNHSFLAKVVEYIGKVLVDSRIASFLRYISLRPFYCEGSFFYRIFESLNKKTANFRDKAFLTLKDSFVFKSLSSSKIFPITTFLLVPIVSFYAFIDEIGRDFLGQFALFSLWDEAYLLLCALFVFSVWFFKKQRKPLTMTPVGMPMLLLIAVSFYLYLLNSTYPQVALDGFRVVVQYILWFFIINSYLTDDKKAYLLARLIVYVGGAMGLHGLMQYIMKVPTPKNWMDQAENSTATRVFSIVESPNILGSIFILILPLCLAMVLQKKRNFLDRSIFFVLMGAMGLSLILTLSRGAWFGAAIALFVFCLAVNPRWLILLGLGGSTVLFLPSVMSRIQYMISPQYIVSSLSGGRLKRYQEGFSLFMANLWEGVGLGHFGGAVAMNNKDIFPKTFYMDNYWLKTAVEMGLVGIIAFGILIITLVLWSIRSVKQCEDYDTRLMAAGGFAGICGIIVHNFGENIFEVPYMVVYFWVVASIVLYFGLRRRKA